MKMGKMTWTMVAGCVAMLAAVFLLPALGVKLGGAASFLIVLLCPLSHLLMMGAMGKSHGHGRDPARVADGHVHDEEHIPGAHRGSVRPHGATRAQGRA